MRRLSIVRSLLIASTACLGACGSGGSGGKVQSTPPPPTGTPSPTPTPTPTPPPTILSAATSSQQFVSKGASYVSISPPSIFNPMVDDSEQLLLRYDAPSNTYEIKLPATSSWAMISPAPDSVGGSGVAAWLTPDSLVHVVATEGQNTSLLRWSGPSSFGVTAVAIPAPASAIPTNGSGSYSGTLAGVASERLPMFTNPDFHVQGQISGTISLTFDFGSGALGGSIAPKLGGPRAHSYTLPVLAFTNTVHAVGSTSFSGSFATSQSGLNSFSGLFAGPLASEVAGSFAFPYLSPVDGLAQQAGGAFIATKGP